MLYFETDDKLSVSQIAPEKLPDQYRSSRWLLLKHFIIFEGDLQSDSVLAEVYRTTNGLETMQKTCTVDISTLEYEQKHAVSNLNG